MVETKSSTKTATCRIMILSNRSSMLAARWAPWSFCLAGEKSEAGREAELRAGASEGGREGGRVPLAECGAGLCAQGFARPSRSGRVHATQRLPGEGSNPSPVSVRGPVPQACDERLRICKVAPECLFLFFPEWQTPQEAFTSPGCPKLLREPRSPGPRSRWRSEGGSVENIAQISRGGLRNARLRLVC